MEIRSSRFRRSPRHIDRHMQLTNKNTNISQRHPNKHNIPSNSTPKFRTNKIRISEFTKHDIIFIIIK